MMAGRQPCRISQISVTGGGIISSVSNCIHQFGRATAGLLLASLAGTACNKGPGPTSGFAPTHVATVHGRVVSSAGVPLASVLVTVMPPANPGYLYASNPVYTNARGEFTYQVSRMMALRSVGQPDTVTAQVAVARSTGSGEPVVAKTSVLVTFVPFGATPPVSRVSDVVLPIPNP